MEALTILLQKGFVLPFHSSMWEMYTYFFFVSMIITVPVFRGIVVKRKKIKCQNTYGTIVIIICRGLYLIISILTWVRAGENISLYLCLFCRVLINDTHAGSFSYVWWEKQDAFTKKTWLHLKVRNGMCTEKLIT